MALHNTGVAGEPHEYFNPVLTGTPWMQKILGGAPLQHALSQIQKAGTTPNGMFGAKLHWLHAQNLAQVLNRGVPLSDDIAEYRRAALRNPPAEWLWDSTGVTSIYWLIKRCWLTDLKLIWVRRRNSVARAISLYRALHTGVWHREQGDPPDPLDVLPDMTFNAAAISALRIVECAQNGAWSKLFTDLQIKPHEVWYEDLVHDFQGTVTGVLNFLGVKSPVLLARPGLDRQADFTSLEWEVRYRLAMRRYALSSSEAAPGHG